MKKKVLLIAGILLLAAAVAVYFRPLPLADTLSGGDQLMVTLFEVEISDGQPDVEYPKYDQLTQEQQTRIRELFAESSYRRTFGTLFSDGSMDGLGDRIAYVHVFDGDTWEATVALSDAGECSVHNRTYRLNHAPQLVEALVKICEE